MSKMQLNERILNYMQGRTYAPMTEEELMEAIPLVEGESLDDFWEALKSLQANGNIVKTRFETLGLPERMGLVVGRFQLTGKGFGFVIPDNKGDKPDVFIPPRAVGGAMNNDRVMARINNRGAGESPEGEVIRIITHANPQVVGIFKETGDFAFVVPDDKRIGRDIYVQKKHFGGARNNQKVVVTITAWPTESRNAEGRIDEVLGNIGDPGLEILSIIKQNGLPLDFPPTVKRAAERIPAEVGPADLKGRADRRDLPIITVDGEDAKDFDDAVYVRRQSPEVFFLGVYIADVSHYVRENSVLDKEARERSTSVYLVDRVLPMLPFRLSNGICSLNEGVDRLVLACEMQVGAKDGQILGYEIVPAVMRSQHRMTYTKVRKILVEKDAELRQEYQDIVPMLEQMEELCQVLHKKRSRRGAVDFDLPEQKVILDEVGRPVEIVQRERTIAEAIIEEFMLAANETVAKHMALQKWPFVYRVHGVPASDKVGNLAKLLANFKIKLTANDEIRPLDLQRALEKVQDLPEERLINTIALRSMRQAVYQTENIGHFGLAAEYYTHFTSPIRRYPDLLVHRLLHKWLKNPAMTEEKRLKGETSLESIAAHASIKERDAAEAERATVDLKKAEYMVSHIGEEFDGVISGVTAFGMFVELPNGVEGLVHISSLTDDYYEYEEEKYALLGNHTNKSYRLGDKVRIEVLQVNLAERSIDFIMAGESEAVRNYLKQRLAKNQPRSSGTTSAASGTSSQKGKRKRKSGAKAPAAEAKSSSRRKRKQTAGRKRPRGGKKPEAEVALPGQEAGRTSKRRSQTRTKGADESSRGRRRRRNQDGEAFREKHSEQSPDEVEKRRPQRRKRKSPGQKTQLGPGSKGGKYGRKQRNKDHI
jgi:ribonuclease R